VAHTEEDFSEEWDLEELLRAVNAVTGMELTLDELREDEVTLETREDLMEEFATSAREAYDDKENEFGSELMRELERYVILQTVDRRWREHLENMEYMREGIYLRSFAQKDPLTEYRAEGHAMFEELSAGIREEVVLTLFHAQIEPEEREQLVAVGADGADGNLRYEHESLTGADAIAAAGGGLVAGPGAAMAAATPVGGGGGAVLTQPQQQIVRSEEEKIGRNDPCWCGSGKKYKKCHGS